MPTQRKPRLGVVHDISSLRSLDVVAASRRLCEPVFIINQDTDGAGGETNDPPLTGGDCDISGLGPQAAARTLRDLGVEHIITFSERQLLPTARIAAHAGYRFLPVETVLVCRDKLRQRRALADAGVDVVRCRALADPAELASAITEIGLPAVVKPRRGMGSLETARLDTADDVDRWIRDKKADQEGFITEFVVEELLVGDTVYAGEAWGDYVSVESVVDGPDVRHVCVTGKFPLSPPFRESGMVVPSTLGAEAERLARTLAGDAVRALGIDVGITHTELKLTPTGPRVIEVNARLGGYVPDILRRATGFDLVTAALRNAIGLPPQDLPPTAHRTAYQYFFQPPQSAGRLASMAGPEAVAGIEGVARYVPHLTPGTPIDWRWGTGGLTGTLYGEAADHQGVLDAVAAAADALDITYG